MLVQQYSKLFISIRVMVIRYPLKGCKSPVIHGTIFPAKVFRYHTVNMPTCIIVHTHWHKIGGSKKGLLYGNIELCHFAISEILLLIHENWHVSNHPELHCDDVIFFSVSLCLNTPEIEFNCKPIRSKFTFIFAVF